MPTNLKRIAFIFILFLTVVFRASSPTMELFTIFDTPPVEPYKNLISAIGFVETMNNTLSYNALEQAAGIFQIRPVRLADYNRRTGNKFTMKDVYNYDISAKIFLYYADLIGPYDFEQIARRWNGSGHMTNYYWDRIKKSL